jgi:hypothetical protein
LELHGWPWGSSPEREERGKGKREGRAWLGERLGGAPWGGGRAARGTGAARSLAPLFGLHVAVREKKGVRSKEKRRERKEKEKGKGKKKRKKMGKIFQTWKFLERKIKDNL